jgi:hypothetical protein
MISQNNNDRRWAPRDRSNYSNCKSILRLIGLLRKPLVLGVADTLTKLPYSRLTSRLVDRAIVLSEGGEL